MGQGTTICARQYVLPPTPKAGKTCVYEDHHGVSRAKTQVENSSMRDRTCEGRRKCFVISEHTQGVGETTQLVKCLLCRREDPSSIPRIHIKMPGVVASACKPRAGEKLTGGILGDAHTQKNTYKTYMGCTGEETHTHVVCNIYTQCSYKILKILQEKGGRQFSVLMRLECIR